MKKRKVLSAIAAIVVSAAACTMVLGAFSADNVSDVYPESITVSDVPTEVLTTHSPYQPEIGPDDRRGKCSSGQDITWELSKDGTLTISGKGVLCDSPWQLYLMDDIRNVVIGEGITSVGLSSVSSQVRMFRGCSNLESVVLPDTLVEFDGMAFADCDKLSSIDMPEKLAVLSLVSLPALKSVTIPDNVRELRISGCDSLTELDIPDSVTKILSLGGNSSLKSVKLPSGLTELDSYLFDEDVSLETVVLPENVTVLPRCLFYGCSALETVVLPENINRICDNAFAFCSSLKSIVIPDSVTDIEREAFRNCDELETVTIPRSVKTIGYDAFANCPSLKAIRAYRGSMGFIKANALDVEFVDLEKAASGDSNCDERVDISDAVFIMQSISNPAKYSLTEQGKVNADIAGDGDGVTNLDALAIQKKLLKLE